MSEKRPKYVNYGYQPSEEERGYQPNPSHVNGGYQPPEEGLTDPPNRGSSVQPPESEGDD